jgi:hypothetical protein
MHASPIQPRSSAPLQTDMRTLELYCYLPGSDWAGGCVLSRRLTCLAGRTHSSSRRLPCAQDDPPEPPTRGLHLYGARLRRSMAAGSHALCMPFTAPARHHLTWPWHHDRHQPDMAQLWMSMIRPSGTCSNTQFAADACDDPSPGSLLAAMRVTARPPSIGWLSRSQMTS